MFPASLLTLFLVLSITASPVKTANSPTSVPITHRLNFSNGTYNVVAHDRARLQALGDHSKHGQRNNVPLTNNVFVYSISVDIGNPPISYNLLLDSGSAITWVGASTPYEMSPGSVYTHQPISEMYDGGYFEGIVYRDTVTLGPGLTVAGQQIGVARFSHGFHGYDGVFGIGPVALTLNTLLLTPDVPIPTVTNNLVNQYRMRDTLGVFFKPYAGSLAATAGQLTFGGTDSSLHDPRITCGSFIDSTPASGFWGTHQSITYGGAPILGNTVGIVHSSHVLIAIATEAFQLYEAATGGQFDPVTELLVITNNQYNALQTLDFHIGAQIFTLIPNAQIWPRALNTRMGGQQDLIYLIVRDLGTRIGEGNFDIVSGYVFMQRFYTIFQGLGGRVCFSETQFTLADTN
ncbi:family A1 protease [Suillus decipiens]|nr:family A1 protease [Suillus decipiens]